jgi:hypothetical protein
MASAQPGVTSVVADALDAWLDGERQADEDGDDDAV